MILPQRLLLLREHLTNLQCQCQCQIKKINKKIKVSDLFIPLLPTAFAVVGSFCLQIKGVRFIYSFEQPVLTALAEVVMKLLPQLTLQVLIGRYMPLTITAARLF